MEQVCNKKHIKIIDDQSDDTIEKMADFLKVLSDPTRLKIVLLLSRDLSLNVGDIAQKLDMTPSATSHQLAILKRANLVSSIKNGKNVSYRLSDGHIYAIVSAATDHALE